jgi:hypothetical protein
LWNAEITGVTIWPIVFDGRIYVTTDAGRVAALKMYP